MLEVADYATKHIASRLALLCDRVLVSGQSRQAAVVRRFGERWRAIGEAGSGASFKLYGGQ